MATPSIAGGSVRARRTRLSSSQIDRLAAEYPGLPSDYLAYVRDVGWGTADNGHMIYRGPIVVRGYWQKPRP